MKWGVVLSALSFRSASSFVLSRPPPQKEIRLFLADQEEPDLFEYFDPLLSPHAYPNGISPDQEPSAGAQEFESARREFGFRTPSSQQQDREAPSSSRSPPIPVDVATAHEKPAPDRPAVDPAFTFDPTLSPHEYARGTPDVVIGDEETVYVSSVVRENEETRTVGILLMDHGSRNAASNERLHELARIYQASLSSSSSSRVVVRAAHMEIAKPSIPEGIQALVEEDGVDEIVCHPFFLSPAGRHAKEDIPRILEDTIEEMELDIPVVTTDPTGANVDAMIGVIHSMVSATSSIPIRRK